MLRDSLDAEQVFRRLFVSIEGLDGRWAATTLRELPTRVTVAPRVSPLFSSGPVTAFYRDSRVETFRSVGLFAIAHGLKSPPADRPLRPWLQKHLHARLKLEARRGFRFVLRRAAINIEVSRG